MMPLPPYPFLNLAREQRNARARTHEQRKAHERQADQYIDEWDALEPVSPFDFFRRIVSTGPIGALRGALNRRIDAPEERRFGASPSSGQVMSITSLPQREQEESNRAA
jgi:hypothetical protein